MPRLRKAIFNNGVYFLTLSTQSGIMLPANPLVHFIVKAAMLRAIEHHPIKISHYIVNGTHIHMIVRAWNPQDIPGFMERFKTESAHYLNRLVGRTRYNVWCRRYDSPRLISVARAIEKIVYIYTNPVKDGLIHDINKYPGMSSWSNFNSPRSYLKAQTIRRDDIVEVNQDIGESGFYRMARLLKRSAGKIKVIPIDTNDWLKGFDIESKHGIDLVNQEIRALVKAQQLEIQVEFAEKGRSFMGSKKLRNQGIDLSYEPKRGAGRKLWCMGDNDKERKQYISFIKALAEEAREVYLKWCRGDTSAKMPVGMFAPNMPVQANLIFC